MERCAPGHAYSKEPVAREHYQLHVILAGKGVMKVGGMTFHLHKNQAFLLKPGDKIFYQADMEHPWEYCWITIDGSLAKEYLEECGFADGVYTRDLFGDPQEFSLLVRKLLSLSVYDSLDDFIGQNPNAVCHYASKKAARAYHQVTYGADDYLVFGRESRGLDEALLRRQYERCIRIPMVDGARSLNLSNSVAIVLYELRHK